MPSANRFVWLRDTMRNHPITVASTAASAGVLLGGFVAFQLLAPTHPRLDSASAAQPATIAAKAESKPARETTGSAAPTERAAPADCENETWPHLSPQCVEEMRTKNRARVISTDKLERPTVSAAEAPPAATLESKSPAPATANTASVPPPTPVDLVAAPSAVFAAPEGAAGPRAAPPQPAGGAETKKEKRIAAKAKLRLKAESRISAKQDSEDDEDTFVASNNSDDSAFGARSDRRLDRRRVLERWTEQDYDVPASNGDGQRRVTVIRRNSGGLFEDLFGN